jgi:Protein of unknown function (DUF3606)
MNDVYRMHRRARDRTRIRAQVPLEIRYWAATLRCTQADLCTAMNAVGTKADDVRRYLGEPGLA